MSNPLVGAVDALEAAKGLLVSSHAERKLLHELTRAETAEQALQHIADSFFPSDTAREDIKEFARDTLEGLTK
jgi:hypothetical protein